MRQIASIAQAALLGRAFQVAGGEDHLCRLPTNCMVAREVN
ncbi:hypothetical protein PMIN01_08544 [Paraphaeosphaeria minitans]|uniref:Uncharacterized protein n=1 Tax=Paraphaeosphaeria minitans TaxID=565426 RepID=A0A9P6KNC0_9PLEO|nr:hypothetical protein PMIN01_08544 [Paraphaeosphaeria minitans]